MSRSANWESAYKGKSTQVAVAKRPFRAHRALNNDLSEGKLIAFYAIVVMAVLSYFVYLNQATLNNLINAKAPNTQQVKKVSKIVTR